MLSRRQNLPVNEERCRACFLVGLMAWTLGSTVRAQDAGLQTRQLWKAARDAFAAGNYAVAVDDFNKVITGSAPKVVPWGASTAPNTPKPPLAKRLEPFYMMGAAYNNAGIFPLLHIHSDSNEKPNRDLSALQPESRRR